MSPEPIHCHGEQVAALNAAYDLLREIARRPSVSASEATQEEAAEEHRPVNGTAEEIAA